MLAVLLPLPALSNEQNMDLDDLTPEELSAALEGEVGAEDLAQYDVDMDQAYPLEVLLEAILGAFSDAGDDADEQVITEEDLKAEMDEAGTDLRTVVWNALQRADNYASMRPASFYLRVVANTLARKDGLTLGGIGATQSKDAVRATIVRARR